MNLFLKMFIFNYNTNKNIYIKLMKLYKIENENEIWYFTTKSKCSRYLGCSIQNIDAVLEGRGHRAKGYTVEVIEDDYVMSKFIDPEGPYTENELVLTKQMFELLKQVIENDKRIEKLDKKLDALKKIIEKANVQD